LRIAYDHQIFCAQSVGGISRYFSSIAEQLYLQGEEVGVFAPLHRNQYLDSLPKSVVHGFRVRRYFPKTGQIMLWPNRIVAKKLVEMWQPDIVHETYYSKTSCAPIGAFKVLTVYDMIHEKYPQWGSRWDQSASLKRMALDRADHVICISENTKKDLLDLYNLDQQKVSVVHLGVSNPSYRSGECLSRGVEARPYLLYVGARPGHKNFLGLLKAYASSYRLRRDFDLVAFGGGEFTHTELQELAMLELDPNQVRQLSGGDELLAQLYGRASAFIYPSLYEGFGLPPLEAMGYRCPVICSNTSSMPEVIGDAGEYFNPEVTYDMSDAIERVVYFPSRAEELVRKGQQRQANFSWERCAGQTLKIYSKLAAQHE
jgi:glycosyltransferase involved in cell wall biosynthesis